MKLIWKIEDHDEFSIYFNGYDYELILKTGDTNERLAYGTLAKMKKMLKEITDHLDSEK